MVDPDSPPDVCGPSHLCYDYQETPNNFEALVNFEFPLQR